MAKVVVSRRLRFDERDVCKASKVRSRRGLQVIGRLGAHAISLQPEGKQIALEAEGQCLCSASSPTFISDFTTDPFRSFILLCS